MIEENSLNIRNDRKKNELVWNNSHIRTAKKKEIYQRIYQEFTRNLQKFTKEKKIALKMKIRRKISP